MMQPRASGAKLRGGGPILNRGSKAMIGVGLPPPRTAIGGRPRASPATEILCLGRIEAAMFKRPPAG